MSHKDSKSKTVPARPLVLWLAGAALLFLISVESVRLYELISKHTAAESSLELPEHPKRVLDLAGTLQDFEIRQLTEKLQKLETRRGSQMSILIIPQLPALTTIEEYSITVAEKWKLGRKGIDDGILMTVAMKDRKLRLEIGYGLEGALPDARCNQIIERIVVPEFRNGYYYRGIDRALDAIEASIAGEGLPEPEEAGWLPLASVNSPDLEMPVEALKLIFLMTLFQKPPQRSRRWYFYSTNFLVFFIPYSVITLSQWMNWAWVYVLFFVIVYLLIVHYLLAWGNRMSGGSTSDSYTPSGGFFSSSGGNYSGGGGSFGGGGASGSW